MLKIVINYSAIFTRLFSHAMNGPIPEISHHHENNAYVHPQCLVQQCNELVHVIMMWANDSIKRAIWGLQ